MGRVLALDLGEKRIGIAISDPTQTIAQPFKTIPFKTIKLLISVLTELIENNNIELIVVGIPLTMKGGFSAKTNEVTYIFEKLKSQISTSMLLFDERLTTALAHKTMHQLEKKPSKERDKIDQLAAVHLLQNYLDTESNKRKIKR
jgi:putative Holliday junction resolvase